MDASVWMLVYEYQNMDTNEWILVSGHYCMDNFCMDTSVCILVYGY
jgi:hypothetical protein